MKIRSWHFVPAFLAPLLVLTLQARAATPLTKQAIVTSGLNTPVFITSVPTDSTRMYVVEEPGRIRVIKNGSLLPTPFLDITSEVLFSGEQGLLGLAFHPNYATNGYFYVYYIRSSDGASQVSRFKVSANPDLADVDSESTVITVPQTGQPNHKGGMLAFGPNDHYLYIGLGDGGGGGDPNNYAQNTLSLFGKMLRLDIDTTSGYKIPPSNPYVGNAAYRPEIWAYGLRNPWRYSFDRATADLYIADVGQGLYEEIDVQPAASTGGENYGWHLKEGYHCYDPPTQCDTLVGLTDPVLEYNHSIGCAVAGGYVYRGCAIPDLQGTYFFSDYCTSPIFTFKWTGGPITQVDTLTSQIGTAGMSIVSFGEDYAGELYFVDLNGGVYKIVPDGVPSACGSGGCCVGKRGNVNGQGIIDAADLASLVSYLTGGGFAIACEAAANINGSGIVDATDLSALVSYLTGGGFPLVNCP